jgi:hypothetical protein
MHSYAVAVDKIMMGIFADIDEYVAAHRCQTFRHVSMSPIDQCAVWLLHPEVHTAFQGMWQEKVIRIEANGSCLEERIPPPS